MIVNNNNKNRLFDLEMYWNVIICSNSLQKSKHAHSSSTYVKAINNTFSHQNFNKGNESVIF